MPPFLRLKERVFLMYKKLPIYILIVYFLLIIVILLVQLTHRKEKEFVAVGFNDRLNNAVVVYENSPLMLKHQAQRFINDENKSEKPISINGVIYLPLSFFENGFDAVVDYNDKGQVTIKYNNKALIMNIDSNKAVMSDAEKNKNVKLNYSPVDVEGECFVAVRDFADCFSLELFYDKGLIILSNIKDIFNKEDESGSIEDVRRLVYNLPKVGSYSMAKGLKGGSDNYGGFVKDIITGDDESLYVICQDEYVYYINDDYRLIKADGLPYGEHSELADCDLPEGFSAASIEVFDGYVCVEGTLYSRAAVCVYDTSEDTLALKKCLSVDGAPVGAVFNNGYLYFGGLVSASAAKESEASERYLPTDFKNMRYFSELNGNSILNIGSIDFNNFTSAKISGFLGVNEEICFCGSGVYIAQSDKNNVYGDDRNESYSNIYKLIYENGYVNFGSWCRVKGTAEFAVRNKPGFILEDGDGTKSFLLMDSALKTIARNSGLQLNGKKLVCGEDRVFLLGSAIDVIDSKNGEYCGSFVLDDEKLYLYNDERIIGIKQSIAEGDKKDLTGITDYDATGAVSAITISMYDISEPDQVKKLSEEIIENADTGMFDNMRIEMGSGIVILPVKIWEENGLYSGKYAFMESEYYGLAFKGKID